MSKGQVLLLIGALALVVGLAVMPTVVVDNDREQVTSDANASEDKHVSLSDEAIQQLDVLRQEFSGASTPSDKMLALDSLVSAFVTYQKYDSAAKYAEAYAKEYPSFQSNLKAGDLFYEAFNYAVSKDKAIAMGKKARGYYESLLEENPNELDLKVKMGVTLMTSENPMTGVLMIREVLEEDPSNRNALFQLGVLSIQSGQLEKAESRFEKLVELYPDDEEAMYYLAVVYAEDGHEQEASKLFDRLEEISKNGTILQAVKKYKESTVKKDSKGSGR